MYPAARARHDACHAWHPATLFVQKHPIIDKQWIH